MVSERKPATTDRPRDDRVLSSTIVGRPRVRTSDVGFGLFMGGLAGGLLARSPLGALGGATLGGLLGSGSREVPQPLELALRRVAEERGARFVSFHREGARGGKLSIRNRETYHLLVATADDDLEDRDAIDDDIYDKLKKQVEQIAPAP